MFNWNWKSFFSNLSPASKKTVHRPAPRPSFRLQLDRLESRALPSGGCHVPAQPGPLPGQYGSHHGTSAEHHDRDHGQRHDHDGHHHHGHQGGGNNQGGGNSGGGSSGGGQGSTPGSISGSVVNGQNNSPVSGVTVTLTDNTTGASQSITSGPTGTYSFAGLQPGTYTVVETPSAGFQPVTSPGAGSLGGTPGTGQISNIVVTNAANGTGYVLAEVPPIIA